MQNSDLLKKIGKTTKAFLYHINKICNDCTVEVTNSFKGLDLIDKLPEELWVEVHNIVQKVVTRII